MQENAGHPSLSNRSLQEFMHVPAVGSTIPINGHVYLASTLSNFFSGWNTWGVNVINTWANTSTILNSLMKDR